MIAIGAFVFGFLLLTGVLCAADSKDRSVRYVARSKWGGAVYFIGLALMVLAIVGSMS